MELKQKIQVKQARRRTRFNRTFMELKLIKYPHLNIADERFNRTFMELKRLFGIIDKVVVAGFNRTFMELKRAE